MGQKPTGSIDHRQSARTMTAAQSGVAGGVCRKLWRNEKAARRRPKLSVCQVELNA